MNNNTTNSITKQCSKCNEIKSSDNFSLHPKNKDGFSYYCKLCAKEAARISYQKNKERHNQQVKEYKKTHPDMVRISAKKWHDKNKDKMKLWREEYNQRPENIIKRRESKRKSDRKRMLDPYHRISNNMRGNMYHALKAKKGFRKWEVLVGYSLQDLINHIEPLLINTTMTWDNYGSEWHIDHIKPKSLFKYDNTDCQEFRDCWALSNLQPLPKLDNIRKGNRWIG